jgi:OOP family OmpA-OmpF porin
VKTLKCSIAFLFSVLFIKVHGQNLVPNPSFEIYSLCPNNQGQLNRANSWIQPTGNDPDYFNACANPILIGTPANFIGYQNARTGNGYAGFCSYYNCPNCRDYIEVRLTDTLIQNKKYCVSFYVSLADSSRSGVSSIGAYFSPVLIDSQETIEYLPYIPQVNASAMNPLIDTVNWMMVSDTFVASGGELYMVIGVFAQDSQLVVDTIRPNLFGNIFSYYYIDDVSVTDLGYVGIESQTLSNNISLFPNPSDGTFQLKGNFPENSQLHIYNLLGEEIIQPISLPQGNQAVPVELSLAEGIYIYRIISGKDMLHEEKLVIVQ